MKCGRPPPVKNLRPLCPVISECTHKDPRAVLSHSLASLASGSNIAEYSNSPAAFPVSLLYHLSTTELAASADPQGSRAHAALERFESALRSPEVPGIDRRPVAVVFQDDGVTLWMGREHKDLLCACVKTRTEGRRFTTRLKQHET